MANDAACVESALQASKIQADASHLMALPSELLLQICKINSPHLTADPCSFDCDYKVEAYLENHALNRRMYDIALDAFFHDFVLEINMRFHCFDNRKSRWINDSSRSCGLQNTGHKRRITRSRITVDFEHIGFKREVVDRVVSFVRKLSRETGLRYLSVTVETYDHRLSSDVAQMLLNDTKQDGELAAVDVECAVSTRRAD